MTTRENFHESHPNCDFSIEGALHLLRNQIIAVIQTYNLLVELYNDNEMRHYKQVSDLEDELSETKSLTYPFSSDGESVADFLERSQDDE